MDVLHDLIKNLYVQIGLLIVAATAHGYVGAWLAVRMLFRPRQPVKVLGITVFPQGMIPRHRERLANAIGKAVGEELVSQETILEELTGKDFLRTRIQRVVDSYTSELLAQEYPSLIEALPRNVREPVLDAISALQQRLAEHIRDVLGSPESLAAVRDFVTERLDDLLSKRVSEVVDDEMVEAIIAFLEGRIESVFRGRGFEANINDFVSRRIDELINSQVPLGELFTDGARDLLKEKALEQIDPAVHQLAEIAAAEKTRTQISSLIKQEVHSYYENLSFFKKIFVSRENLLGEVDALVNESMPRRIEETLKGAFFTEQAREFISNNIDSAFTRPLPAVVGNIAPEQLDRLKEQVTRTLLRMLQSDETRSGITAYLRDLVGRLRPHSIDAILQMLHAGSEEQIKSFVGDGLLRVIAREETSKVINEVLANQVDRLLSRPIGCLADHMPEDKIRAASEALTEAIVSATAAKLPEAIAEFDVGGVVREKIRHYPAEKLEALVLSVAKEHLRTIEFCGAIFGFMVGIVQAIQFYIYAR